MTIGKYAPLYIERTQISACHWCRAAVPLPMARDHGILDKVHAMGEESPVGTGPTVYSSGHRMPRLDLRAEGGFLGTPGVSTWTIDACELCRHRCVERPGIPAPSNRVTAYAGVGAGRRGSR
jgi:hypothetical protein